MDLHHVHVFSVHMKRPFSGGHGIWVQLSSKF